MMQSLLSCAFLRIFQNFVECWQTATFEISSKNQNSSTRQIFWSSHLHIFQNRCSESFCINHRRTLMLESLFNKVADVKAFSCKYYKIFMNSFFYRTLWWLLLNNMSIQYTCKIYSFTNAGIAFYFLWLENI